MNQTDIIPWRKGTESALARIRERQRAAAVLLASGLDADARETLAASFSELSAVGNDMLEVAGQNSGKAGKLAAGRLERLSLLAGSLRGETAAECDELVDAGDWTLESLEGLLQALKAGPLRTGQDRRRQAALAAGALAVAAALGAGVIWGPSALGKFQRDRDAKHVRETQAVLTELASLALNAKKASGK